jgi:aminopeptidase-like protein
MARVAPLSERLDDAGIGEEIYQLASTIYPICRSITGDGVRETLDHLARRLDLEVHEVPSGTQVFDWTIPREWSIRDAFIKNSAGERIIDFRKCNLHVLNYSQPVRAQLPLESLHRGETEEEFLLSAHICHPSLANDNCSGLALLTLLAERLAPLQTRYSYRFVFAPGTIGAIAWLARNEHRVARIRHGLVVSCLGDGGGPTYKKSRRGDALIDRAMTHVLRHMASAPAILDFFPYGYDERQYCSPGFDLPVGSLQRSQFGTFPEYHTSADNLDFIRPEHLSESYRMITAAIDIVENDWRPLSTTLKCEPQLGRRGLYAALGGDKDGPAKSMAFLWILNLADGRHSLLDVAERAKLPFPVVAEAARLLRDSGLLVEAATAPG